MTTDTSKLSASMRESLKRYVTFLPDMAPEMRREILVNMLMQAYHDGAADACSALEAKLLPKVPT